MAEGLADGFSTAGKDIKSNWIPFLIIGLAVVVGVLWYDHKNNGALTTKIAGLPLVGKLFA